MTLSLVGFDADDTLWHNERFFRLTEARFADLLRDYAEQDHLGERLLSAQRRNLGPYGFGIKAFVLSMIETAIEVTEDRIPARVIREIMETGQEMLTHPVDLLPHAREAVEFAAQTHRVLVITKGDLLDQERKVAQSGLGDLFDAVEIVSDKTPEAYSRIFTRHGEGPEKSMMIGNSMKSDVLPAIDVGAWGVFVPHGHAWALEHADPPEGHPKYREIGDLSAVEALLQQIQSKS